MTDENLDRRSQRTRETLTQALLELVKKKHYDQITVQDIVEQANIGRSTFYAHYENKDALLLSGFEQQLAFLAEQIVFDEEYQLKFDTSAMFQHVYGHYEIYRTLIWGSGFKLLIEDGHAVLSEKIEERLACLLSTQPDSLSIPLSVLACALAGQILILLKWWLDNKMPYDSERMDEFFQQLIMPGVRGILT